MVNLHFHIQQFNRYFSLAFSNQVIKAKISDVYKTGGKGSKAVIEYDLKINNEKYHIKSYLAMTSFKQIFLHSAWSQYYVGKEILVLTNANHDFFFPEDNLRKKEIEIIFQFLIFETALATIAYLFYSSSSIKPTSNKKILVYLQDDRYKINHIEYISDYMLEDYIESETFINKLTDKCICIGFSRGKNFIEVSRIKNEYFLRLSINNKEEYIQIDSKKNLNIFILKYKHAFLTKHRSKNLTTAST